MKRKIDEELLYLDNLSSKISGTLDTLQKLGDISNQNKELISVNHNNMLPLVTAIDTLKTKIEHLKTSVKNYVPPSPNIIGELKWVKIGTPLQRGWTKRSDITKGFSTIISTTTSNGSVPDHQHSITKQPYSRIPIELNTGEEVYYANASTANTGNGCLEESGGTVTFSLIRDNSVTQQQPTYPSDANLAAGQYAELWEYTG